MLEITRDLYSQNKDIYMDITTRASDLVTRIKFLLPSIDHFRVPKTFTFKTRLSAKPFM